MQGLRVCLGAWLAWSLLALVPAARADVVAVSDKLAGSNLDITVVNTASGQAVSIPAGINTAVVEEHPSISADGNRLVFERRDPSTGVNRIIVADLSTGAMADVFNAFEAGSVKPEFPSITPDGSAVLTGGPHSGPILTSLANFPAGPYPHNDLGVSSGVFDPVATGSTPGSTLAFDGVEFGTIGGSVFGSIRTGTHINIHPTIGTPNGVTTIVYDSHDPGTAGPSGRHFIEACSPVNLTAGLCLGRFVPPGLSSGDDETRPAFTPDSRYLGFIRDSGGHDHLTVWSVDTQTIISDTDIGTSTLGEVGRAHLSLYVRPVLIAARISSLGVVNFSLLSASNVGILIQRVTGHRRLFGRRVPRFGRARRIPLGAFRSGHRRVRWNLKVGGKRLRPGTYQVTLRALTRGGRVRDLGRPRLLRVRR